MDRNEVGRARDAGVVQMRVLKQQLSKINRSLETVSWDFRPLALDTYTMPSEDTRSLIKTTSRRLGTVLFLPATYSAGVFNNI